MTNIVNLFVMRKQSFCIKVINTRENYYQLYRYKEIVWMFCAFTSYYVLFYNYELINEQLIYSPQIIFKGVIYILFNFIYETNKTPHPMWYVVLLIFVVNNICYTTHYNYIVLL